MEITSKKIYIVVGYRENGVRKNISKLDIVGIDAAFLFNPETKETRIAFYDPRYGFSTISEKSLDAYGLSMDYDGLIERTYYKSYDDAKKVVLVHIERMLRLYENKILCDIDQKDYDNFKESFARLNKESRNIAEIINTVKEQKLYES